LNLTAKDCRKWVCLIVSTLSRDLIHLKMRAKVKNLPYPYQIFSNTIYIVVIMARTLFSICDFVCYLLCFAYNLIT
jgi:hypothetical protein